LKEAGVKFVDASWYLGGDRNGSTEFKQKRIPQASFFDIDDIGDQATQLPHMLPSEDLFASKVGALGIENDDRVVIYGGKNCMSAPRVWWMFHVFSHKGPVQILDGGIEAWIQAGGSTEGDADPLPPPVEGVYKAIYNSRLVTFKEDILPSYERGATVILDARPAPRFFGDAPEPRPGLALGHIPHAVNVPFVDLVDKDDFSKFKSEEEVKAVFDAKSISTTPGNLQYVNSCGSGVTACVVAFSLHRLGIPITELPVYDGSWSEWGAGDMPVEK
jgi:thiosulfate/3-mercaptopyruvate sulfurtransferase